jgi:hypothetical protein
MKIYPPQKSLKVFARCFKLYTIAACIQKQNMNLRNWPKNALLSFSPFLIGIEA